MSEKEALHGLNCPKCGGVVPVPEGLAIVHCPYCDLRSLVRGDRGLRRYQIPLKIERQAAASTLGIFLSKNWAIARDAARRAEISEVFLVHLPFWAIWERAAAWALGQKKVGSGKDAHYNPREVRIVQDLAWNGAACDVSEFGVQSVSLGAQEMIPFNPDVLHRSGMVFEPTGSFNEAIITAERQFQQQINRKADLDRLGQLFVRFFRKRMGIVYYPLWVLRYLYRGRAFQVVVDGTNGKVLYGKAPGNTLYRSAVLVGGMALGAFLALDVPALILKIAADDLSEEGIAFLFAVFLAGVGLMAYAYRTFRHGEQFEHRENAPKWLEGIENPLEMITQVKDLEKWIDQLN